IIFGMKNELEALIQNCKLCPMQCGANRLSSVGACGVSGLRIAKYYLHPFEEPCISFKNGSGTIFFSGCNLRCKFCQNYEVSRAKRGKEITPLQLADIFKELEDMGAENISLVTPTHFNAYLVAAFELYRPKIPVVYNTGGYEKIDALKRIDPFIDIYLPDIKFYSSALSKRYLGKEDYFDIASEAVSFMANAKPLKITDEGKMLSGCIVRHLVMPLCTNDSKSVLKWFKRELPETTYLSLMSQYTPFGEIDGFPELSRKITAREYESVVQTALDLGIERLFLQERKSVGAEYIPKWDF
ncbi:MAG: radical SAM protein, partial [Clostridia bacterium]|nr:radical SAM protein [Clostridia bacterium]